MLQNHILKKTGREVFKAGDIGLDLLSSVVYNMLPEDKIIPRNDVYPMYCSYRESHLDEMRQHSLNRMDINGIIENLKKKKLVQEVNGKLLTNILYQVEAGKLRI